MKKVIENQNKTTRTSREVKNLVHEETRRPSKGKAPKGNNQTKSDAIEKQSCGSAKAEHIKIDANFEAILKAFKGEEITLVYQMLLKQLNDAYSAVCPKAKTTPSLEIKISRSTEEVESAKAEPTKTRSRKAYDGSKGVEQVDLKDTKALKALSLKLVKVEGWTKAVALQGNTRAVYQYLKGFKLKFSNQGWMLPTESEDYKQICKDLHLKPIKA